MSTGVEVKVENQLVRFTCPEPVDQELVVAQLGGVKSGGVVIKILERPSATIVIDEQGKIVVHGTKRVEVARKAAKEILLLMGKDDSGMTTELGPIVASFNYGGAVDISGITSALGQSVATLDERLGCAIIEDSRHDLRLNIWPNGKAVAFEARHPRMVAMSAVHWKSKLLENNLLSQE